MAKHTTTHKPALLGSGRFQWSGGAWLGTTLGSSSFLLPTIFFLTYHGQRTLAILALVALLILAMTAIVLWRLRHSIYPFSALMYFLTLYALLVPAVWLVIGEFAQEQALLAMSWPNTPMVNTIVFLIPPMAILWFWLIECRSKTKPKQKIAG